ncbi:uncharacterized protein BT62DRAFT_976832 [Guyanagaster necrorhizus]|uniref:Dopa 4,5-dioxygenase n=1 Tax=Guyanagaster necrorhizus TaxID=856835 RepID=A0A9P7VF12_9AGAR|nr:uncharacterized protein BT62DRAFT_976832 [Guyanagaster necrorhizus MCA 3950]KAG7439509.1 hypothetical protein BT62DRAFT_976832 [Guyanagaster necrorhizus MCA 3950]
MGKYPSPLIRYENASPLPTGVNPKGESLTNDIQKDEQGKPVLSKAYDEFMDPIDKKNNGFDFHIYYMQNAPDEMEYGRKLHERIRREFPEMRIFRFWERPVGPHPIPMFEVDTFTPHMTGTLFSWLVVNRGPCSVLIHPNTGDSYRDHTELVTWMGRPWPLNTGVLNRQ